MILFLSALHDLFLLFFLFLLGCFFYATRHYRG
jgi:hypothetical protein